MKLRTNLRNSLINSTSTELSLHFEIEEIVKFDDFQNDFEDQNNMFIEPYEDPWKKSLGTLIYMFEVVAGFVILALIKYETGGHVGHFRTALNQLVS